jgi:uncharacterized surface protein with fasciclin (FAS1) repeats
MATLNVETLNGAEVAVTVGMDGVKVNSAKIITTEIVTDNGEMRTIDTVLFPPTIVLAPSDAPSFPNFEQG